MASVSKSFYIGRLTRDPEVRKVTVKGEEVTVANFTVAVDPEVGTESDFYNIVCWRGLAETVGKYLGKGRLVYVEGRARTRSYPVTKDGVEFQNFVTETHAAKVDFLDRAPEGTAKDAPAVGTGAGYQGQNGDEPEPF